MLQLPGTGLSWARPGGGAASWTRPRVENPRLGRGRVQEDRREAEPLPVASVAEGAEPRAQSRASLEGAHASVPTSATWSEPIAVENVRVYIPG